MEDERAWYDTDENRAYEEAVKSIKNAVLGGAPFDDAAGEVDLGDESLTGSAVSDALKVMIAEMHLIAKQPLAEVADKLQMPLQRVEAAKAEMMREIEAEAIARYKESQGPEGNA